MTERAAGLDEIPHPAKKGILSNTFFQQLRLAASSRTTSTATPTTFSFPCLSGDEDGAALTDTGIMNSEQFEKCCVNDRDAGVWGGEPEFWYFVERSGSFSFKSLTRYEQHHA
jgi:hypothetical protein